jgi:heme exporter protein A
MPRFTGDDLTCIRGERIVFSGLNFALEAGDALVLTGPNGSGKSSLLRLMAGLLTPAAGRLAWDGEGVGEDPESHHARLHYVGHLDAVKPALTVAENLGFWADLHRGGGAAAEAVDSGAAEAVKTAATEAVDTGATDPVDAALAVFAMERLATLPARYLSAGQRRRVNLARVVAAPAPLWLLDEPTTALDAQATARLEAAIAGHRGDGGMVAVATHAALALDGARELTLEAFADAGSANP